MAHVDSGDGEPGSAGFVAAHALQHVAATAADVDVIRGKGGTDGWVRVVVQGVQRHNMDII